MPFFSLFVFTFGLIVGSFLNCLIYCLEGGRKNLLGRSFCPSCRHILEWKDLIPVLSFIFLGGRCRYCRKKISWQYPLVELAAGFLFVLVFWHWNLGVGIGHWDLLNFIYLLFISSCLVVVFVFDLKHYLIPDEIIYPAVAVSGIWYFVSSIIFSSYTKYEILNTIYSAFGAALFFYAIYHFSRGRAMGLGDAKLAFFMGLFLGFPQIVVALFFAFLSGALVGIILMVFKKKTLKSELPFGPFLVSGVFFALFFGQSLINFYLGLLGY